MAVSSSLGGNVEPTALLVILSGIFRAVIATPLMERMKTTDYAPRWFAVGVAPHRINPPTEIFWKARS